MANTNDTTYDADIVKTMNANCKDKVLFRYENNKRNIAFIITTNNYHHSSAKINGLP